MLRRERGREEERGWSEESLGVRERVREWESVAGMVGGDEMCLAVARLLSAACAGCCGWTLGAAWGCAELRLALQLLLLPTHDWWSTLLRPTGTFCGAQATAAHRSAV